MKKLDYDYVKKSIEKEGYVLLDDKYIDAHSKMNVICSYDHKIKVTGNNGKKGVRCPYCYGNNKHSIEEVKESFSKEGYTLLTKEYKGVNSNLHFICDKGHECNNINYKEGNNGKRCTKCNSRWHGYTIDEVRNLFEKEGYTLLTKEYKRTNQALDFICPRGHYHSIIFNNGLKGHRCQKCQAEDYRCYDNLNDGKLYTKIVRSNSMRNYRKYKKIINPDNLEVKRNSYHLDHRYPISKGFENKVPTYIISSVINLQVITQNENLEKGTKEDISLDELYNLYFSNINNYNTIGYRIK